MSILVSGIIYKGQILAEKKFYPEEGFVGEAAMGDLFQGIFHFVDRAFKDELNKLSIGNYTVLILAKIFSQNENLEVTEPPVLIFSIIEKDTKEKPVLDAMKVALEQFFNRYSNYDIRSLRVKKTKKFASRLEAVFSDLALKLEDRFKSIY